MVKLTYGYIMLVLHFRVAWIWFTFLQVFLFQNIVKIRFTDILNFQNKILWILSFSIVTNLYVKIQYHLNAVYFCSTPPLVYSPRNALATPQSRIFNPPAAPNDNRRALAFPRVSILTVRFLLLTPVCAAIIGLEAKPCNGEQPLVDDEGKEYDCGSGPNRRDCPSLTYCHQTPRFARCCRKGESSLFISVANWERSSLQIGWFERLQNRFGLGGAVEGYVSTVDWEVCLWVSSWWEW